MFEYKHGSSILSFPGLCMSKVPRVRDWQEGGFSAWLWAPSVAWELRSPILGLLEETFLDFNLLQASCVGNAPMYVRRKAFAVFCILVTCGAECFCSVFAPCLKRQHKGMGRG